MKHLIWLCLLLAACSGAKQTPSPKQAQRPNILVIISDDHALNAISSYNKRFIQTPNIDRIGKEGAVFRNAFVTNSLCAPSRAVLLTGKYSHVNGHVDNRSTFDGNQDNFAKQLQKNGYETSWIGKWHLDSKPQGFNEWQILPGQGEYYNPDFIYANGDTLRTEGYVTDITTNSALNWLQEKRDETKPFAMVVGMKAPHRNWLPDLQDLRAFDQTTFPLPETFYDTYESRLPASKQEMTIEKDMTENYDLRMLSGSGKYAWQNNYWESMLDHRMNAEQRKAWLAYYQPIEDEFKRAKRSGKALAEWKYQQYMRMYLATILSVDRNVGRILDYLDQTGLAENTLVIYTSDQGFYMGEHGWYDKRFMYEESFRMPLLARYPQMIRPKTEVSQPVVNIDFAPTFLQLANVETPREVQGRSFLPLFNKKPPSDWRTAVYYHYYEYAKHRVAAHFGVRNERYKLIRYYHPQETASWELFDLQNDPHELRNVFQDTQYQNVVRDMKRILRQQIELYKDDKAMTILDGI